MGGYNGLLGYGGARGRTLDMTDEEIYNKLRREYPGASTAALYTMMDEVKKSQNPKYTVGVDPADGIDVTNIRYSSSLQQTARPGYQQGLQAVDPTMQQQGLGQALQNTAVSNSVPAALTMTDIQKAYSEIIDGGINSYWNGELSYTFRRRTYAPWQTLPWTAEPSTPAPQKPVKKQPQVEIAVTGKRSIILDEDI